MTPGELETAQYLRDRGLTYEYEALVGPTRRPDFTVHHPSVGTVVIEVMEPEDDAQQHVGAGASAWDMYATVRKVVDTRRKRKQAKASARAGYPFVVVIPQSCTVVPLDSFAMRGAMFGDIAISVPVGPDDYEPLRDEDVSLVHGGGGRIQPDLNRSMSALAALDSYNPTQALLDEVVTERTRGVGRDDGIRVIHDTIEELTERGLFVAGARALRLDIYHNPWARQPLPEGFAAASDEQVSFRT